MSNNLTPGTRVEIRVAADHSLHLCQWWPEGVVTGTVEKVFKNGNVAVAVERIRNLSADGLKTLHFKATELHAAGAA